MHAGEVHTDADLVRRLIAAQFPRWAALPIAPVASGGTDNALYRLGADMVVRLPRIDWAVRAVEKEQRWLPRLAPHLPLAVPAPLAAGSPGEGYPWRWSVYRWLEGRDAVLEPPSDPVGAARDMAAFIAALRGIDATGGPRAPASDPRSLLEVRDGSVRAGLDALKDTIDAEAATRVWDEALRAPPWAEAPVWVHADLHPANLLVRDGRVCAVIDFGKLAVGDPACDAMLAWSLFSGESRDVFRAALAIDDASWARARGLIVAQAVIALPYYRDTNPAMVAMASRNLAAVLLNR